MTAKSRAKAVVEPKVEETPAPEVASEPARCNVPSAKHGQCRHEAEWRGLCAAHRATMRGLAGPKEEK